MSIETETDRPPRLPCSHNIQHGKASEKINDTMIDAIIDIVGDFMINFLLLNFHFSSDANCLLLRRTARNTTHKRAQRREPKISNSFAKLEPDWGARRKIFLKLLARRSMSHKLHFDRELRDL